MKKELYVALQHLKHAIEVLKQFAASCKHDSEVVANARAEQLQREQRVLFACKMALHYDAMANAVGSCLQSNYEKMGLVRPFQIEDVLCSDNDIRIDGDITDVTFRYEADRHITDNRFTGGKRIDFPRVSIADMESVLNSELRKYTFRRGYDYRSLSVDDIAGDKVRISIYGVTTVSNVIRGAFGLDLIF